MRLWLLTTEYPPQSGGGISTYCWHTARMFARHGVEVTVFVPGKEISPTRIVVQEKNIRLVYFRQDGNWQNGFLGWEAALSYQFANVLHQFQLAEGAPDFVESQEYLGIAYYPLQRMLLERDYLPGTRFFVTAHAPSFLYRDFNQAPCFELPEYWIGEMERSVLRSAHFVFFPSRYLFDRLAERMDLSDVTTEVLRNPFQGVEPDYNYQDGDLIFFGKLTPQKGGLEMLNYLKSMWDQGFSGKVSIIGSGEHFFYPKMIDMGAYVRKRFDAYIRQGLLRFEGHIPPEKLPDRLAAAHAVIVPSTVDNLPYTVLEAMSLGKVTLVSEQGGHAELVSHGQNGFTFSHERPDSFSDALTRILALDRDATAGIGNQAHRTIVAECSYESVLKKKLEYLNSLSPARTQTTFPFIRPRKKAQRSQSAPADNTTGLLSIVIPFHNLGSFLKDCITSILNSDYPNKEIIIINDGSTEQASLDVLEEVAAHYAVRIIHQSNRGLCYTRNKGAEVAQGEFLAFLDADDIVEPSYYSRAVEVLKRFDNVSFVGCWAQYFGENDEIWPAFNPEPPYLLAHNMINSSAVVYRRKDFIEAGGNDLNMIYGMEDYETVISLVKKGFQGVVLPHILWNYRIRTGSMAQSFNRFSELYLYRLISRKHADFFAEYAEQLVNILNANGPAMSYKNPTLKASEFAGLLPGNTRFIKFIKRNRFLRKIAKRIYTLLLSRK